MYRGAGPLAEVSSATLRSRVQRKTRRWLCRHMPQRWVLKASRPYVHKTRFRVTSEARSFEEVSVYWNLPGVAAP